MKTQTQLPEFRGKPLIEILEYIPQVDFLKGEFGEAVLEEYNARVEEDYSNNSNLNVLTYEKKIVKGSNSFAVCLVNGILREEGLRTATQSDLEKILKIKALNLRRTYEDTGLVLRDDMEPNSYLAKDLLKQLGKTELPVMIPLYGLELSVDDNSPHGLAFKVTEHTKKIHAPILNENSAYFSSEDIDENGLPKRLGKGNRCFHTRETGLSRVYLDSILNFGSRSDHLESSYLDGRVVVVSGENAQKI